MTSFRYLELPIAGARSLAWHGASLIDWLDCASIYGLDGSRSGGGVRYSYRFDAVAQSPSGEYTVLYERLGTKGIVLFAGEFVREINRSYYQADRYDYPIALFCLADGRDVLAHCPNDYNKIEIELVGTGERLTPRTDHGSKPIDVFHSGLAASPDGAWLLSAGWIWQPYHEVTFYPVENVLNDPSRLDRTDGSVAYRTELASAAFLDGERAVLASPPNAEDFEYDGSDPDMQFLPGMIGVYRPATATWESCATLAEPAGQLLAINADHALALFEHPKLIHLPTGEVIERWPAISSGVWNGCISGHLPAPPPTAWDPVRKRLAIATGDKVQILIWTGIPSTP